MRSDRFAIRLGLERDLAALPDIEREAALLFRETPYSFLASAETLPIEAFQAHLQQAELCIAADESDSPVGFAIVSEIDRAAYLNEIDVRPAFMRRGIGTQLVEFAVNLARERGYKVIYLSTFKDLPWNAPFYANLGFQTVDESELTIGFQRIRQKESDAGFPMQQRAIMRRQL